MQNETTLLQKETDEPSEKVRQRTETSETRTITK